MSVVCVTDLNFDLSLMVDQLVREMNQIAIHYTDRRADHSRVLFYHLDYTDSS